MSRSPFRNTTVLIMDDDKFVGKIISSVLSSFELAAVHATYSLEEGIREFDALSTIDLIITDWVSEEGKGLDFVNHVRASGNNDAKKVPIILCTGRTDVKHIIKMRDAGINEIVVKPVAPKALLDKMSAALFKERAFVDHQAYTGPDRRRRVKAKFGNKDRRGSQGLRTDEIDQVMAEGPAKKEGG